jgi:hypothetical protein
VELAGMNMGYGGFGSLGMAAAAGGTPNPMQHLNQFMLQNLQAMLTANPGFLTGGIPNKLLNQMWMNEPAKVMMQDYYVCVVLSLWFVVYCFLCFLCFM